jgi:hypothetical protein
MQCAADLGFVDAFDDYKRSMREFSDKNMSLMIMKARFSQSVCCLFPFPPGPLNAIYRIPHLISSVFGHVLTRGPSQTMAEMDSSSWRCKFLQLLQTRLVMNIHSKFGVTHTKLRNKIDPIQVHKMAVVETEQKRLDREAGLARNRKKRKFGRDNTAADDPLIPNSPDSPDSESLDFQQYAQDLIRQAQNFERRRR